MHAFSHLSIRVISLTRATARRSAVAAQLASLRIPFRFYDGIDAAALSAQELASFRQTHKAMPGMSDAELACDLSHFRVISAWMEEDDTPYLCVLEDDATLG
ncbi:glycosyltransferase family 25 protein [uncultured Alsobacter sp.]|uniref:glycosyltransferase family 25 protein n=1 Tax=uncultured Alsobacter sp. TaxID=1748258 RepID=UPI0025F34D9C|nr:glycosyltransferase family 25 protein [uncultured Alsobacter sp.]